MNQLRTILGFAILFMGVQAPAWTEPPAEVTKVTIPLGSIRERIPSEFFQPDFPNGDSNYHSLVSASDGKLYFSIDTHNTDYACRFYAFDPQADAMNLIAEMDAPLGIKTVKAAGVVRVVRVDGEIEFSVRGGN